MGTTTNAYLFYGFDFYDTDAGDEPPVWWKKDDSLNWEEHYAALKGIKNDSGLFTPEEEYTHTDGTPERAEDERKYDEYQKKKAEALKYVKEKFGIGTHCHGECPVYFVHLKIYSASRGYPQVIDPMALLVTEKQVEELKEFCDFIGIPWKEPGWLLASYWSG